MFGKQENLKKQKQDENASETEPRANPHALSQGRPIEELNREIKDFLAKHELDRTHVDRSIHETLVERAPELLKQEGLKRTPTIIATLQRALSRANEEVYARDHIRIPDGDLPLWHYYDLEESLGAIDTWRDYLSLEALDTIADQVRTRPETALEILNEYRSLALRRESYTETQRNVFGTFWSLHKLAADAFPRTLVILSDDEFAIIGSEQFASSLTPTRRLAIHAKLAEYDPDRFRAIFGREYTPEQIAKERKEYETWEWENPLRIPKRSSYLETVDQCMGRPKE